MKRNSLFLAGVMGVLAGCGALSPGPSQPFPVQDSVVVKSRSSLPITVGSSPQKRGATPWSAVTVSANQPITVINAPSTSMTLDNSLFSAPTISSQFLDFGFLQISALLDNNLKVCGDGGNQQCGTALIRMYTTGTPEAGLYNSADGYGIPIFAGQSALSIVGLNVAGAVVMQSISIPATKHVLRASDFSNPKYNVKVDFSNAGAGTYSTTLVVEYALAP